MRIIVAGIIGRYPWGGVTWCSLMYLLGLRKLGHDVYYLEDTCECNYDPVEKTIAREPEYARAYIKSSLEPFGFADRWCYIDYRANHYNFTEEQFAEISRTADMMLVLSGGCWVWREHYRDIPKKIFIDSDPAFTQFTIQRALANRDSDEWSRWYTDFISRYDHYFTFGGNIGTDRSHVPTSGINWQHTHQPICLDEWQPTHGEGAAWSTVMTWKIHSFTEIGGNKDQEFLKILNLSEKLRAADINVQLAVDGPLDFLREHGWNCIEAFSVSSDLWKYHQHITRSRAEFSVAKHTYVATRSGWFSDRSQCYLAAGKPVVVQDTGFSDYLPIGEGLLAWTTADEALECILRVEKDYKRHSLRARELAEEFFAAEKILARLLDSCE